MQRIPEDRLLQEMQISQGSDITFTFMAKFSLALRDGKGKAGDEMTRVSCRVCGQEKNGTVTFNTVHKMKQWKNKESEFPRIHFPLFCIFTFPVLNLNATAYIWYIFSPEKQFQPDIPLPLRPGTSQYTSLIHTANACRTTGCICYEAMPWLTTSFRGNDT